MSLALHWALQVQYMAKKKESIKRKIKKTEDLPQKKKKKKSRKISRTEPG